MTSQNLEKITYDAKSPHILTLSKNVLLRSFSFKISDGMSY